MKATWKAQTHNKGAMHSMNHGKRGAEANLLTNDANLLIL